MKYWVYKDSRILGPFDKDAFAGLPGVDASTLVCAGESAAARHDDWRPAGDIADLSTVPFDRGAAWPADDLSSTHSLLDRLQIDAAGLIADDEFPGAVETIFQDAEMKRSFDGVLAKPPAEDAELKRSRDRVTELTAHIEALYKRVSELETGQTDLLHRLAEKEIQLRSRQSTAPPPSVDAPPRAADLAPVPVPAPAPVPPPAPAPSALVPPPSVPPPVPLPISFPTPPPAPVPAPAAEPAHDAFGAHEAVALPPIFAAAPAPAAALPPLPSFAPAPQPASEPDAPAASAPPALSLPAPKSFPLPSAASAETPAAAPAPTKPVFERKTFKVVPTVRAFRVVGQESIPEAGFAAAPAPAPMPELAPVEGAAPERGMPAAPVATAPAPAVPAFDWNAPAPAAEPAAAPISLQPSARPSEPAPVSEPPPPTTFSFGGSTPPQAEAPLVPVFSDPASFRDDAPESSNVSVPPATSVFSGLGNATPIPTPAPSTQEVLARLAKPATEPATAAPRAARSNKRVYLGIGSFVIIMAIAGTVFLRHPKDLKQMAELDDGRARVGAEPVDDASRPPLVKPQPVAQFPAVPPGTPVPPAAPGAPAMPAAPAAPDASVAAAPSTAPSGPGTPAPAEEAQAASPSKLDAAVAAVKEFPLDGERGSVGQWLQFSYSASPDAGKESWSASETADKTYLVEYRFTPSAQGVAEVHYLFEVDMDKGFVIGKNLDAQSMLAGGARVAEAKPKPKPKKRAKKAKTVAKRAAAAAAPKEVPLLPLPNEGELRPPAEDDGAFTSDTVNTGL